MIDEGSGWRPDQRCEREKLVGTISKVTQEVEDTEIALEKRRICNQRLVEKISAAEEKKDEVQMNIDVLIGRVVQHSNELATETRKKIELSDKLGNFRDKLQRRQNELFQKQKALAMESNNAATIEVQLDGVKCNMEDNLSNYKEFLRKTQGLTKNLKAQIECNNKLEEENQVINDKISGKEMDLQVIHKELEGVATVSEVLRRKIEEVEADRIQYQEQSDRVKFMTDKMEQADLSMANKEYEVQARQIENLLRELDIIERKTVKSDKSVLLVHDLIAVNEIILHNLRVEKARLSKLAENYKFLIKAILKDRKGCSSEKKDVQSKFEARLNELQDQDKRSISLKKFLLHAERYLSQQEKIYESIRHENDALSKHLLQVRNFTLEERRNFKNSCRKLAQIKEDIISVDDALIKEHFFHFHVGRDQEILVTKLEKTKKQITDTYKTQCLQEAEIQCLQTIIYEAEHERKRLITNIRNTVSEHAMLESKSTQQREQINKLCDQASHLKTSLHLGEVQYQKKIRDIKVARDELQKNRGDHSYLEAQLADHEEHHQILISLERNLSRTRLKNKALSDELDQPLNIHGYRYLKSRDVKAFEKLLRVRFLQKRLIAISDTLSEKCLTLEDKVSLFRELECLAQGTLTESEVQSQLDTYTLCYKDKVKQFKTLHEDLEGQKVLVCRLRRNITGIEQQKKLMSAEWMKCTVASSIKADTHSLIGPLV